MRTFTVRLPDDLANGIAHEAKIRRVTKSAVVRERLAANGGEKLSLWDRMKDFVIDDPASPTDLSMNKGHMAGYGRGRSS